MKNFLVSLLRLIQQKISKFYSGTNKGPKIIFTVFFGIVGLLCIISNVSNYINNQPSWYLENRVIFREAENIIDETPEIKVLKEKEKEQKELEMIINRKEYGERLRESYLDKHLNIFVVVSGYRNTTITLYYVLFTEVWVHEFSKGSLITEMQNMGFKKVILNSGDYYGQFSGRIWWWEF